MKLIKSAIIYAVELPGISDMEKHLSEAKFNPLSELEEKSAGFVPDANGVFVPSFVGGYCFTLRLDEKIIPASAINQALQDKIKEIEESEERKVRGKERARLKDEVVFSLLPKAFAKTTMVPCFYRPLDKILIVATSSKRSADVVTGKLIRAIGSVKASTIHIDGIKQSITSKLAHMLREDDETVSFGEFSVGGVVKMRNPVKHAVSYKLSDLHEANTGILEAIDSDFQVTEIELNNADVSFRLDSDFVLKGINIIIESDVDLESEVELLEHERSVQSLLVCNAAKQLMKLFEYKPSNQQEGETQ